MIRIRPSHERGHADHGWLQAHHTFSFAGYIDREHMGYSVLRVLNQDRIQPGQGFGTHPHNDMEIVTYVLSGVLEHADSMGNGSRIVPGEVQLMSAGTGVTHSEFNGSDSEPLHLLQMWVLPAAKGTEPRYEQKAFDVAGGRGALRLVASPDGRDGSLTIGQDVRFYAGKIAPGEALTHTLDDGRKAWLHVATGAVTVNGHLLSAGDGAGIESEEALAFTGEDEADVVLFDLP